jgi:hypothetical protein
MTGLPTAAAHRMSDIVTQALHDGHCFKWLAIRIADGGSDGVIYDNRADAIRFQFHPEHCAYVLIQPCGAPPEIAQGFLNFYRGTYDAGHRTLDAETPDYILPLTNEDMSNKIARLFRRTA